MSLLPRRSRESRTRSPYVFMHIQISPPLSLSILSTSEILFFFNFLRRAFLRGRSGSSYVVASLRNRKSPARFPVASAFLTLYLGVRREEEEGGGMLSSLLITILCDSLSWFVTVARLKERLGDEDGASVGAPRCDEDEEANRERERKKDRRFKIGAEASYLLERNIFLPCFARCGKRSATLSPRFIRSSGGTIDGSAISKLPIIREIGRLASLFLCLLDGSAVTSDEDDLRSSYFQLITAIHYGERRRTRACVCVRVRCTMLEFI